MLGDADGEALILIVLPGLPLLPDGGDPVLSLDGGVGDELSGLPPVLPVGEGLLVVPVEPLELVPLPPVSPPVPVGPISLLLMGELSGELPVLPVGEGEDVAPTPAGPALAVWALELISLPPAPPAGGDPAEPPPSPSPNRARHDDDPPPGGDDEDDDDDELRLSVSVPKTSPCPDFGSLGLDSNGSEVGAVATSASFPDTGSVVSARGRDTIDAWGDVSYAPSP